MVKFEDALYIASLYKTMDFMFWRKFRFIAKLSWKHRKFRHNPHPADTASPCYTRWTHRTHRCHPKSTVYIRGYTFCCTVHAYWQMHSDTCSSVLHCIECFIALRILCVPLLHAFPFNCWQAQILLLFPQCCPLQNVMRLESCSMYHFQSGFLHLFMMVKVRPHLFMAW